MGTSLRVLRRVHEDEAGQSLVIVLSLVLFLFLLGSALAVQASTAIRSSVAGDSEADALHAADAGAELGIWWQRQGNAGNPPNVTINGLTVSTTISSTPPTVSGAGWEQWGFSGQSLGASTEPGPPAAASHGASSRPPRVPRSAGSSAARRSSRPGPGPR